ncbi:hypothetical protein BY996DRAFT_4575716, partial [Phakopsora pachyrhizi]
FTIKLISLNTQWVNKPKFHVLFHLNQFFSQFGPDSLFAIEKFGSYNGVVQQVIIHFSHQGPSNDITNHFLK